MRIHDISVPIGPETVSWANAYGVDVRWHSRLDRGDRTTNSSWLLHAHTGTHLDAPAHHLAGSVDVEAYDLARGIGPCRVAEIADSGSAIDVGALRAVDPRAGERLLLRTSNTRRRLLAEREFTSDYVGLTAEAAEFLVGTGIELLGVDYLSVEAPGVDGAPAHRLLLGAGIAVLEGISLTEVSAGEYTLAFLPLRLTGAEAAPGRAVLIEDDHAGRDDD